MVSILRRDQTCEPLSGMTVKQRSSSLRRVQARAPREEREAVSSWWC